MHLSQARRRGPTDLVVRERAIAYIYSKVATARYISLMARPPLRKPIPPASDTNVLAIRVGTRGDHQFLPTVFLPIDSPIRRDADDYHVDELLSYIRVCRAHRLDEPSN